MANDTEPCVVPANPDVGGIGLIVATMIQIATGGLLVLAVVLCTVLPSRLFKGHQIELISVLEHALLGVATSSTVLEVAIVIGVMLDNTSVYHVMLAHQHTANLAHFISLFSANTFGIYMILRSIEPQKRKQCLFLQSKFILLDIVSLLVFLISLATLNHRKSVAYPVTCVLDSNPDLEIGGPLWYIWVMLFSAIFHSLMSLLLYLALPGGISFPRYLKKAVSRFKFSNTKRKPRNSHFHMGVSFIVISLGVALYLNFLMIVDIRKGMSEYLGAEENQMGVGQVMAVIMVFGIYIELAFDLWDIQWKKSESSDVEQGITPK